MTARIFILSGLAAALGVAGPAHSQAISNKPKYICPPVVQPVRNTEILIRINLQFDAGAPDRETRHDFAIGFATQLNALAKPDGNHFSLVFDGDNDVSNITITPRVVFYGVRDGVATGTALETNMVSWNNLDVNFRHAIDRPVREGVDPEVANELVKRTAFDVYQYVHLGYQAGPDVCRPWIKK